MGNSPDLRGHFFKNQQPTVFSRRLGEVGTAAHHKPAAEHSNQSTKSHFQGRFAELNQGFHLHFWLSVKNTSIQLFDRDRAKIRPVAGKRSFAFLTKHTLCRKWQSDQAGAIEKSGFYFAAVGAGLPSR